jgi:pimeloyl-ACP methyl ester carboxylesterase
MRALRARAGLTLGLIPALAGLVALPLTPAPAAAAPSAVHVGTLTLTPCDVLAHALCGKLAQPWDRTGRIRGSLDVGFAFVPASDRKHPAVGTLVPHEGGPGYSTTGSAADYAGMYGSLLDRRNLLLVDQRGTGMTAPIDCPGLQDLHGPYAPAAATCAKKLGNHADLYGTADSADDLAAVITALRTGHVDLYGDSYGTFFAEVFAGRHPTMLRSIVLDSAYPTTGESQWYPTQGPAMLRSIDLVCQRTPACASLGASTGTVLAQVLAEVRRSPWHGLAPDEDGVRHRVTVDGPALVSVVFGATYGPAVYREVPGALRSAINGDKAPLLRLVAEDEFPSGGLDDAVDYSEGLDAAVTCHDYPQLYDMSAPPALRKKQYAAAVSLEERQDPTVYAPFTISEYLKSDWEEADWCLTWPTASAGHAAGLPAPPSGHYPTTPTLVLSGELDSITTPAEGAQVAARFPSSRQVIVANSFHVTAVGDADACAANVLRAFVARPLHGITARTLACTVAVPPVRAVSRYAISLNGFAPATGRPGSNVGTAALKASATALATVADVMDRWSANYSGSGGGLYGGTWGYSGDRHTILDLQGMRLTRDLAVSGAAAWDRYRHRMVAHLVLRRTDSRGNTVKGSSLNGSIAATWDTRAPGAFARIDGRLGGHAVHALALAP